MTDLPAIITIKEIESLTGLNRAGIYKLMAKREFPKAMKRKNSNEKMLWKKSVVLAWMNEGDDDMLKIKREDLNKLIDQRIIEMLQQNPAFR